MGRSQDRPKRHEHGRKHRREGPAKLLNCERKKWISFGIFQSAMRCLPGPRAENSHLPKLSMAGLKSLGSAFDPHQAMTCSVSPFYSVRPGQASEYFPPARRISMRRTTIPSRADRLLSRETSISIQTQLRADRACDGLRVPPHRLFALGLDHDPRQRLCA